MFTSRILRLTVVAANPKFLAICSIVSPCVMYSSRSSNSETAARLFVAAGAVRIDPH